MDTEQIALVRSTWTRYAASDAGPMFYRRLFELEPLLEPVFSGHTPALHRKFSAAVSTLVERLDNLSSVVPALQALGRRHVGYGVQSRHYDTFGTALLSTLEQTLGAEFTPEAHRAWTSTYRILAEIMRSAAAQVDTGWAVASRSTESEQPTAAEPVSSG
jgi:hemoglobin-like flavoprotein